MKRGQLIDLVIDISFISIAYVRRADGDGGFTLLMWIGLSLMKIRDYLTGNK